MIYERAYEPEPVSERKNGIPAFKVKEADVLHAVSQWLALNHIPYWRINSGGLKNSRGRLVLFGAKGMADFYAIGPAPEGKSIWIECKRPKGGRLSEAQKEFLDCINRNGGVGIVVNSVDSLENQLKEARII
jgi:hypothetical protein